MTLSAIRNDPEISTLVCAANAVLEAMGYTEHGPRHVGYVSRMAEDILRQLGYSEEMVELAAITGWVHDVGNAVNRKNHGLTGAALLFPILREKGMPMDELMLLIAAVGNHEEETGRPVNPISAALILADKSDAHRTRVRRGQYDPNDIHDRVNYAVSSNCLRVDGEKKRITHELQMDTRTASVMEYLDIYLSRVQMSEEAARFLGCTYELIINGTRLNRQEAQ